MYIISMDAELQDLYNTDPNRPKLVKKGGRYTKRFLNWNVKQIRLGNTAHYADPTKLYNPKTNRLINIQRDNRYNRIVEKQSFIKKYGAVRNNSIIGKTPYFEREFNPTDTTKSNISKMNDENYFWDLCKNVGVLGETVKIIVKVYDTSLQKLADAESELEEQPLSDFIAKRQSAYDMIINTTIKMPTTKAEWVSSSKSEIFRVDSHNPNIVAYLLKNNVKCKIIITKLINLSPIEASQSYKEGETNCLLTPILNWCETTYKNAKSKSAKKKYIAKIRMIKGGSRLHKLPLLKKYKDGVPTEDIEKLCDLFKIKIILEMPFCEKTRIEKTTKDPIKKFHFINSSLDHVEPKLTTCSYDDKAEKLYTRKELDTLIYKLQKEKKHFVFGRDNYGVCYVDTYDTKYLIKDGYLETANKFNNEYNINSFKIDAIKYPHLQQFINHSTHFNGTVDFGKELPNINDPNLRHIDMTKAYTQSHTSKYYDGFVGKITDFRKVNKIVAKGLYYITSLNLINANPVFKFYNRRLNWFIADNIYPDAELRFLTDMGATYTIEAGAFGTTTDIKFNEEMINGKETIKIINDKPIRISYYAKWVGKCASVNYKSAYHMLGSKKYFGIMKHNLPNSETNILYDEEQSEARIEYPKTKVLNLKHIASQILSYQRLIVMEQLLEMDHTQIIRICCDGIYFWKHKFNMLPSFRSKNEEDEKTFNNASHEAYLSNIFIKQEEQDQTHSANNGYDIQIGKLNMGEPRDYYVRELWGGQGGTGKTYFNIHDKGLINPIYIAPSWKLTRSIIESIINDITANQKMNNICKHRALYLEIKDKIQQNNNVFLWDEVSQLTEKEKKLIFKIDGKHIFMGDINYQLEPCIDIIKTAKQLRENNLYNENLSLSQNLRKNDYKEMTSKDFQNIIVLETDRRAETSKELQELKLVLREYIDKCKKAKREDKDAIGKEAIEYCKANLKSITIDELKEKYKKEDLILASKHIIKDIYTEMFSHIEKYQINNTTTKYSNGEIVYTKPPSDTKYELKHGYTIHAIQGETIAFGNNLYIDPREMFSNRMIYTAVSRARHIDQIYIINTF